MNSLTLGSLCYKMAGNGLVTAVAEFVLEGIIKYHTAENLI